MSETDPEATTATPEPTAQAEAPAQAQAPEPEAIAPTETAEPDATESAEATEPADATAPSDDATAPEPDATESAEPSEGTEAAEATAPSDDATAPEADATAPSDEAPAPAEAPAPPSPKALAAHPRPTPRPGPPAGRPTPKTAVPATPSVPAPPDLTPAEEAEAASFGRVDADGTVWVREAAGERAVGQYPGADEAEALALYVRRYADLRATVLLFETRLGTDLSPKEIDATLEHLAGELVEPAAVGDLDGLRAHVERLRDVAAERKAAAEAERAAAKAQAVEARTALVEAAEKIAETDPSRMQWRPAGEDLRSLLDQWKEAQRSGPRIDRPTEDALWKRFSHARSTFDRERRRFFSDLEKSNAHAKETKAALVAEAEALATSTDWGPTAGAYRDLMARWKAAGRAGRKDDDALWARFRAAQDAFFGARDAASKATDQEFQANLEVKLALLEQAEALLPVKDLGAAKAALRDIQARWEEAGKVPRGDLQRIEARLRAVEQAVRDADQAQWRRTNPETRARAEGAAAQLYAAIAQLEDDLAAATKAKDARRIAEATAALEARRAWLEQVERAAADSR